MKSFSYLIVLTLVALSGKCYTQDLHSLHRSLSRSGSDTEKVAAMIKIGEWHLKRYGKITHPASLDSTWYYAKKSEQLSKSKKLLSAQGITYSFFSKIYFDDIQYDRAVSYGMQAVKILEKTKDKKALCDAYDNWLNADLQSIPITDNTLNLAKKYLNLSRNYNLRRNEASALESIGIYYSRLGEHTVQMDYLLQAEKIYEQLRSRSDLKSLYAHMAPTLIQQGKADRALHYTLKAASILKQSKEYFLEDYSDLSVIGETFGSLGKPQESIYYSKMALEITKEYSNRDYRSVTETSLMDQLYINNRIDEAKQHFAIIESYIDSLSPPVRADAICTLLNHSVYYNYRVKADTYAKLSLLQLQSKSSFMEINRRIQVALIKYFFYIKDYQNSRLYTLKYRELVKNSGSLYNMQKIYRQLFKIDSAQGDYVSAIKNFQIANSYDDSIMSEQKAKEIARLETVFKTQEKEKDNQLLKKQAELRQTKLSTTTLEKNLSLLGIIILIMAVALIYRRYSINQRMKKETNLQNEMLENLLNEKEWLLKEIHHRVKNNLQIVMSLLNTQSHFLDDGAAKTAIKNSQDRIHSMSLIHKKLYQSSNVLSINMELYIKELVEYFKVTFDTGQKIKFVMDIEPLELTSSQAVPLGLIINETIINSLKHAFPQDSDGIIDISLKYSGNKIVLTVKDNGIGVGNIRNIFDSASLGIKLINGFSKELNAVPDFINENGFGLVVVFSKNPESNKVSA